MAALKWLLDSDPAIQWQVLRDLTDTPAGDVAAVRARVATEGWGARLLELQSPRGQWGADDDDGWMTTVYALVMLKDLGADPADERVRRAIDLVRERITWWQLDGRPFFDGETEPCINGGILAAGAYFGAPCDRLAKLLLHEQLDDGGWNCKAPPSKRSSFHTTICVLEGLLEYERAQGATTAVTEARRRGQEYLLERRMFRALRSGQVIDRAWIKFAYPPTWHYDVLRGLDHLRNAGVTPDERVDEAVQIVDMSQHQDGRWPMHLSHGDKRILFEMEPEVGKASRWNTLRALRVLKWHAGGM